MKAYLDNASTTPICEAAKKAILENLDEFYNPNSSYESARNVKVKVEKAREKIAELIGAEPNEIYFTSGSSEANSLLRQNDIILGSTIEHHSIVPNFRYEVDEHGIVDFDNLNKQVNKFINCNLISAVTSIYVNNEIGTIQPVSEIANIAHKNKLLYHIDATQALPHMKINVRELGCDMMLGSWHRIADIKYFRTQYYHGFCTEMLNIDGVYFSK